ncbi:hypothetical protein GUITHDRAFT_134689 [Guillardia theta CCMP2712]|uniref:protein O-GlcNAc transferase n=1 Tax=Guillardia theta (strain CCMP2712) TaxID=905079 RepID=L1JRU5_GUITC|nr:hypothetical protein GUITHDRAFT_134689 [Guillardia theta CCMP2712]EKX51182.1 hypothetical protein GUITHDRAFT_134689 [Guillardia theta CCMP2712]|eukprot:XP_005838162.1 hypothetical protein GUITHDRAFT_134689 [Guillardia theta CCMP2712]
MEAANNLAASRRTREESRCLQRAIQLSPRHPEPFARLAEIAVTDGQHLQAREYVEQAQRLSPTSSKVLSISAAIYYSLGDLQRSVADYEAAMLQQDGLTMHNFNNLGISYAASNQHASAVRSYKSALRLWTPESGMMTTSILLNLGNTFVDLRRFSEAFASYRRILHLDPSYAIAHYSLARALDRAGNPLEALSVYRQATMADPYLPHAYSNMGITLLNQNRPNDAVKVLEYAVRLRPISAEFDNLGDAYGDSTRYEDAIATYQKAIDVAPNRIYPKSYYSQLHYLIHTCNFDRLREACENLENTLSWELQTGQESGMTPVEALVLIGTYTDHSLFLRVARNFATRSLARVKQAGWVPFSKHARMKPGKRLRIGYISGGFRHHPDGKNMQGVFEQHDRSRFEVFCFSLKRDHGTPVQRKLQSTCEHFLDYTDLDNYHAASQVNQLGIHVLFDVNGYTGEGVRQQRNIILALSPAKLQYLVSDKVASPPEFVQDYSEKLLLWPHCYFPSDLRQSGGEIRLPKVLGLSKRLFLTWMDILRRTTEHHTTLWLPLFPDVAKPQLMRIARAKLGKNATTRIVWTNLFDESEHLQVKSLATMQLDTFLYCGHTSGADILWAGVPTVTLPGIMQSARVGASLLKGLSLHGHLVARTAEDYADVVVRAIRSLQASGESKWLSSVRAKLATEKQSGSLFDVSKWVKSMESAVSMAWDIDSFSLNPRNVIISGHVF